MGTAELNAGGNLVLVSHDSLTPHATEPSKSSGVMWNFGLMYTTFSAFAKLFSAEILQSNITKLYDGILNILHAIIHVSTFLLRSRRGWDVTPYELIPQGYRDKLAIGAICYFQRAMSSSWVVRILR